MKEQNPTPAVTTPEVTPKSKIRKKPSRAKVNPNSVQNFELTSNNKKLVVNSKLNVRFEGNTIFIG